MALPIALPLLITDSSVTLPARAAGPIRRLRARNSRDGRAPRFGNRGKGPRRPDLLIAQVLRFFIHH